MGTRNEATETADRATPSARPARWAWVVVALVVAGAGATRWRLLELPLERDEGEYAYAGQLILRGVPPYEAVYNMKLPGTYAAYAALMAAFGETTAGVHKGLILVNTLTALLVFVLGRRLFSPAAGVAACAAYALLSVSPSVLGLMAHATHFINLFAVAGVAVLLAAADSGRVRDFFAAGLLFGVAFVMKQHAVFYILFGAWYAGGRGPPGVRLRRVSALGAGAAVPFALTCATLAAAGVFGRFWFWTFTYAREYVSQTPLTDAPGVFAEAVEQACGPNVPLWVLGAAGVVVAWRNPARRRATVFLLGFAAASFLAICPGLYFRPHYFIVLLPSLALFVGSAVQGLAAAPRPRLAAPAVFCALFGWALAGQWAVLFAHPPDETSRMIYPGQPFAAVVPLATYIRERTGPDDLIACVGSEPELYFYTSRRSGTGYIYLYPMFEKHPHAEDMQREMIAQIEAARPKYLVIQVGDAYVQQFFQIMPRIIARWSEGFLRDHYELVGAGNFRGSGESWLFDEDVSKYARPVGLEIKLCLYRRKTAAGPH